MDISVLTRRELNVPELDRWLGGHFQVHGCDSDKISSPVLSLSLMRLINKV